MPVFPLTLPALPSFVSFSMEQKSAVAVSSSPFSGKEQVYEHPLQLWEVSFDLPPLTSVQAAEWGATLLRLNGRGGSFLLSPPDDTPIGTVSGTIIVDSVSGYELYLSGMTGTFTAGDWIQIENGLYRVTVGDTAIAGDAIIEVWPKPRAEIINSTSTVTYTNPKGRFRLFNSFKWDVSVAKHHSINIAAREVV